jgi:hypothetical protein
MAVWAPLLLTLCSLTFSSIKAVQCTTKDKRISLPSMVKLLHPVSCLPPVNFKVSKNILVVTRMSINNRSKSIPNALILCWMIICSKRRKTPSLKSLSHPKQRQKSPTKHPNNLIRMISPKAKPWHLRYL